MAITSDTRPGLFAPGLVVLDGGIADQVRGIDPDLVTVLNQRVGRFEVYDRAAPGGPKWQLVMRVQEPDGSFRPLDGRVLPTLREARGRDMQELIRGIEKQEEDADRRAQMRTRDLGEDLYEIAWAMGRRLHGYGGASVAWQKRTDPSARERIRQEARLA